MQNRIKDIKKIIAELSRELNRAPTRQEIADRVGLPEDKVLTALQAVSKHVSIDEPVHSDDSRKVIDFIPSDLNFSSNELDDLSARRIAVLEKVFSRLSDLEQNILNLRLGLKNNERPKSLREVAEIYGYSIRKVSNIEKNALMFLKAHCILIS
jgi:RNA polymerase primary sigma factor